MKKLFLVLMGICLSVMMARAQKTCVIASAEDHVPIREALIHTNNDHWARTDYRGYFTIRYSFDSASVSKPGFVKTTIYLKNLPDTVFLLPQAKQIGEVEVWGKKQEGIESMQESIKQKLKEEPRPITGLGFDAFGWMDKRGSRDRKHLKKAKKILGELDDQDKKDPVVEAYKEALESQRNSNAAESEDKDKGKKANNATKEEKK